MGYGSGKSSWFGGRWPKDQFRERGTADDERRVVKGTVVGLGGELMSISLLKTKLRMPRRSGDIIARPRLYDVLESGTGYGLILISAPAGYGKTTLLADWIQRRGLRAAWVSLDKSDNDPLRYWSYLIAALNDVNPGVGRGLTDMLPQSGGSSFDAASLLIDLINSCDAELGDPILLAIDDYHVIENSAIHEQMTIFLDHLPSRLRVIIAGRAVPPLPLAAMRASGRVTELSPSDLRFTTEEVFAFCNGLMKLGFDEQEIDVLERRTEGWAAGLQLASLSVVYSGAANKAEAIAAFSGNNRYVFDYFVEEVITRQSREVQDFLLRTSILDRLTPSLCAAVTGRSDSQALLDYIEKSRLFLEPIGLEFPVYRYHTLFADSLKGQLIRTAGEREIAELDHRASVWYAEQGFNEGAVQYALAAKEYDRVADILEEAGGFMFQNDMFYTLVGWAQALPEDVLLAHPQLSIIYAWALTGLWRKCDTQELIGKILERIERIERDYRIPMDTEIPPRSALERLSPQAYSLFFTITLMKCLMSLQRADFDDALLYADYLYEELERGDIPLFSESDSVPLSVLIMMGVGITYEYSGEAALAQEQFEQVIDIIQRQIRGMKSVAQRALGHLGRAIATQNRLYQSLGVYMTAIEQSDKQGIITNSLCGIAYVGLGELYYEWNDLKAAEDNFRKGISLGKMSNSWDGLLSGYFGLARLRAVQGDLKGAEAAVGDFTAYCRMQGMEQLVPAAEAFCAMLFVVQGDMRSARRWSASVSIAEDGRMGLIKEWQLLAKVKVLAAERSFDGALRYLSVLVAWALEGKQTHKLMEYRVLEASIFAEQGCQEKAFSALSEALALGAQEGCVRTFLDAGDAVRMPLSAILSTTYGENIFPSYVRDLLREFDAARTGGVPAATNHLFMDSGGIPSGREISVLSLMAKGLSYKEIADSLFVSVNTVRSHIKNIYQKLDVHNRTEAIERARSQSLI